MSHDLVVTHAFGSHAVGTKITDPDEVDRILASHNRTYVVKVHRAEEPGRAGAPAGDHDVEDDEHD